MDIPKLLEQLSDPDESERLFAADDLGAANDPSAVAPLAARLEIEPSRAVREMILLALRQIESDAVQEQAVRLLSSADPFIRNEAAALLQARGTAALPWLREAQRHPDPDVRKLALEAACGIGPAEAAEFLETALADAEPNVAITAVEQIGALEAAAFKPNLEALAGTAPAPMMALACIEALSQIGDAGSLQVLLNSFGDREELAYALIGALGCLGDSRSLARLETYAEAPAFRQELLTALLTLQRRGAIANLDAAWLARIERWYTSDSPPSVRQDCLTLLERLAAPPAIALARRLDSHE